MKWTENEDEKKRKSSPINSWQVNKYVSFFFGEAVQKPKKTHSASEQFWWWLIHMQINMFANTHMRGENRCKCTKWGEFDAFILDTRFSWMTTDYSLLKSTQFEIYSFLLDFFIGKYAMKARETYFDFMQKEIIIFMQHYMHVKRK